MADKLTRDLSGTLDEDVAASLTDEEKDWLRSWNREDEIPDEDTDDDEDEELPENDYSRLNAPQLRQELENRDLPKSGNKDELIARLEEDDANSSDE